MKASAVLLHYTRTAQDPRDRKGGKRKGKGRGSKGRKAGLSREECVRMWAWIAKQEKGREKGTEKRFFHGRGYRAVCTGEGPLPWDRRWAVKYELARWK